MDILRALGYVALVYLILGVLAAVWMHLGGLRRMDRATVGAGNRFRALITPGLVALWPIMVAKLVRGSSVGPLESPLSAKGLRTLHGVIIAAVSCAVPLIAGAAILNGPIFSSNTSAPITHAEDSAEVAWSQTNEPGMLLARVPERLAAPRLVYWSASETPAPSARVFLRALDGFGTFTVSLPETRPHDSGTIWIYAAQTGLWERAFDLGPKVWP